MCNYTCACGTNLSWLMFCTTTVHSFVKKAKFLLSKDENLFLFSERISQGSLGELFRQAEGRAVPRIFMGGFFLQKYGLLRVILSECL